MGDGKNTSVPSSWTSTTTALQPANLPAVMMTTLPFLRLKTVRKGAGEKGRCTIFPFVIYVGYL